MMVESANPDLCEQCGLPIPEVQFPGFGRAHRRRFCCYGCYLVNTITVEKGEEGVPILFLARLGLAGFLAMNAMTFTWALYGNKLSFLFPVEPESRRSITYLVFVLSVPVYLLIGLPYLRNAIREVRNGIPGVDTLIACGSTAAFILSLYSTFTGGSAIYYDTATMVLVLVTFGRYLEANARLKSSHALQHLFGNVRGRARRIDGSEEHVVEVDVLAPGDRIRILPGEEIPVDGEVKEGATSVNEAMLTGESAPVTKVGGDKVIGGSLNYDGTIVMVAGATAGSGLLARLHALTEEVLTARSPAQLLAERITRVFVPGSILLSLATGVFWGVWSNPTTGLLNGLSVLLIACPCELGIGATLVGFIGYTAAAKRGVLFKSMASLETAGEVGEGFLDKTGTLTEGNLCVVGFERLGEEWGEADVLGMARAIELHSEHPAGRAIVRYADAVHSDLFAGEEVRSLPGEGISGYVDTGSGRRHVVLIGAERDSREKLKSNSIIALLTRSSVWVDDVKCGTFVFTNDLKRGSVIAVRRLEQMGMHLHLVSGDGEEQVAGVASALRFHGEVRGRLRPEEKALLITEKRATGALAAMVGDGINDSVALAAANIGISFRSGTDLSRMASDVVIMDDDIAQVPWIFAFGRRVRRTIVWNFLWAFCYNAAGMGLAVMGKLEPVFAAGAMVFSSFLVIMNSSRVASGRPSAGPDSPWEGQREIASPSGGGERLDDVREKLGK